MCARLNKGTEMGEVFSVNYCGPESDFSFLNFSFNHSIKERDGLAHTLRPFSTRLASQEVRLLGRETSWVKHCIILN